MTTHAVSALYLVKSAVRLFGYQSVGCWRLHFSRVTSQPPCCIFLPSFGKLAFVTSPASLALISCPIVNNTSSNFHTSPTSPFSCLESGSRISFGSLDIIIGIKRLPYCSEATHKDSSPCTYAVIFSWTNRNDAARSLMEPGIFRSSSMWAAIIHWGLPNLSCSSAIAAS